MPARPVLWSIGYVSIAPDPLSRQQLDAILETSRTANTQAGVTGLLLHCDGRLGHGLEGRAGELQVLRNAPAGSNCKLLADYWKAWH
ncbi:MAG: BLUF domain-containing protein [Ramlibacter sp.]